MTGTYVLIEWTKVDAAGWYDSEVGLGLFMAAAGDLDSFLLGLRSELSLPFGVAAAGSRVLQALQVSWQREGFEEEEDRSARVHEEEERPVSDTPC